MRVTNSVAQFCRITTKILMDLIFYVCRSFLDDISVKGPKTDYGGEEVVSGVRRFMLEYIMWLDSVLFDIEHAGGSISAIKTQFCMEGLSIVGYVCDSAGRHPATAKIIKILEWEEEDVDLTSARAFIGVCVFYRIWIEGFAAIAAPIYATFRKNNFK